MGRRAIVPLTVLLTACATAAPSPEPEGLDASHPGQVGGFIAPAGPPLGTVSRVPAGGSCIVDLEVPYSLDGSLSGSATIDYRIYVAGPCGEPQGTFFEEWIARGRFSGRFEGADVSATFVYRATVLRGGEVEGRITFGDGLVGELTVTGNFADGRLRYEGELGSGNPGMEDRRPVR